VLSFFLCVLLLPRCCWQTRKKKKDRYHRCMLNIHYSFIQLLSKQGLSYYKKNNNMQFTPQQLAGGGRYSSKTKIGNWSEDLSLQEVRLAEYLKRKAAGKLLAAQDRKEQLLFTSRVPHSYSSDGNIRFGDTIMLQNNLTSSFLASNLDTPTHSSYGTNEAYTVTASRPTEDANGIIPVARTTFVVMKWPGHKTYNEDGCLRVGEPFLLSANPQLRVDEKTGYLRPPVCLMSEIVDTMRYAAMSNHQRVTLQGGDAKYAMAWTVSPISDRKYHSIGHELVKSDTVSVF
jgi:hypothetical protein